MDLLKTEQRTRVFFLKKLWRGMYHSTRVCVNLALRRFKTYDIAHCLSGDILLSNYKTMHLGHFYKIVEYAFFFFFEAD